MHRASLNHTFRLVWSDVENAFVAVAENVKGWGKGSRSGPALGFIRLAAAGALVAGASGTLGAQTLPSGGQVVAGSASIATSGNALTVTQTTDRMAADWQSFSIGAGNTVNFVQPSAASVALNRVLGSDVSVIQGALNANGQVFLVNPNGVLFSPTAQVNVGGLVASTLNVATADFMANKYTFEGSSSNAIVNQGRITAADGGSIALIAAKITNTGSLTANQGNVVLGAGTKVTLDLGGPVKLQVEQGAIDALIEQGGAIRADGGLVYLTAKAAGSLASSAINHTGVLEASSLTAKGGTIMLEADAITLGSGSAIAATGTTGGGTVLVGGDWQGSGPLRQATTVTMQSGALIDVSATQQGDGGTAVLWSDIYKSDSQTRAHGTILAKGGTQGGNGGRIETSGHRLDVAGVSGSAAAQADGGHAGEWLFDPYNVTITGSTSNNIESAGMWTPSANDSTISAASINGLLDGGTSVTVTTGSAGSQIGDITVASAVGKSTGSADVTLTLRAANSIVVNETISHTGGAGKLNVVLDADNDMGVRNGGGIIILNSNISTGGGNLQFGIGATTPINGVNTQVGGDVYVAGSGARTIDTAGGNVTVNGEMIIANPSGLNITTNGGHVTFGGLLNSGNSYASVAHSGLSWDLARTNAALGAGGGVGDTYLATVTSRLENAVTSRVAGGNGAWLGAQRDLTNPDATAAYTWHWVTGPEGLLNSGKGTAFFQQNTGGSGGSAIAGNFNNFVSPEPNGNGSSGESALQFFGPLGQWNDLTATNNPGSSGQYGITQYIRETNLAASPLTVNAGSGNVTFSGAVGGSKALASLNVTSTGTIAINGGSVTTEGLQTYTGNLTLGVASTVLTQTTANTDFTLQTNRSITNAMGSAASLFIRTTGDIVGATGSSISSSSGTLNITLNSDSDGTGAGGISLYGTTLNSNGGNITLGGGTAGDGSGYTGGLRTTANYNAGGTPASKVGIGIGNSTLSAAGGNISLRGQGYWDGGAPVTRAKGIELVGNTGANVSISTTGAGTITLDGRGGADTGGINYGVNFNNSTGNGTISVSSQTGAINLTGVGGSGGNNNNVGVKLEGGGSSSNLITSTSGAINITGTAGAAGSGTSGIDIAANSTIGGASTTGAITLTADTATLSGSYQSTGALTVKPLTAATTVGIAGGSGTLALTAANFSSNFVNGFSSITVGRSDGTGTITTGAFTVNDNLTLLNTAGGIAIGGALNAIANTLTLNSTGTVSQTAGITAGSLALLGINATHTLTNTSNNVTTLAADTGSVAFYDSNALALGTVGATNGITATAGTILVETGTGDITISQNISASNTGSSAVIVNAGKTVVAGTSTGGNIVLSGSPVVSVGTGGRATLMTGSVVGSTGLTTLVGSGSGNFRYNSDETAANYSAALGAGSYAIYRERPMLTVTPGAASSVYGEAISLGAITGTVSAYLNGDSSSTTTGTAVFTTDAQSTGNAGTYNVAYTGGLSNSLGYGFSDATASTGEYTINRRTLTVTADAKSKIVGTTDPTLTYTAEALTANRGLLIGESLSGQLSRVSGETVGTFAIEQGSLTTANNTNYLIDYVPADLTISGAPTSAPAPQAAITVAQVAAANAVPGDAGFGAGQTALTDFSAPTAQPSNLGGLTYVEVAAVPDTLNRGEPSAAQGTGSTAATPVAQTSAGGRDASGFMRVFVVAGGINLPPGLAQSTSDDSTNKAK